MFPKLKRQQSPSFRRTPHLRPGSVRCRRLRTSRRLRSLLLRNQKPTWLWFANFTRSTTLSVADCALRVAGRYTCRPKRRNVAEPWTCRTSSASTVDTGCASPPSEGHRKQTSVATPSRRWRMRKSWASKPLRSVSLVSRSSGLPSSTRVSPVRPLVTWILQPTPLQRKPRCPVSSGRPKVGPLVFETALRLAVLRRRRGVRRSGLIGPGSARSACNRVGMATMPPRAAGRVGRAKVGAEEVFKFFFLLYQVYLHFTM